MRAEKEVYHAFRIVNEWTEALRYYDGNGTAEQCNPFLKALEVVYLFLLFLLIKLFFLKEKFGYNWLLAKLM